MSNTVRETLFEIVYNVLEQFDDANLKSDESKKRIADEICNRYYDEIDCIDTDINWGPYIDILQKGE